MLCEWSSKSSIPIFVKMPFPQGSHLATSSVVVGDDKIEVNPFSSWHDTFWNHSWRRQPPYLKAVSRVNICRHLIKILLLWTNKYTIFYVNAFLFLITLLHVSKHKHHHQRISLCTKFTKSVKVVSALMYRCHYKIKRLKHHIVFYSKLVTILKVHLQYNCVCNIYQLYVVALYVVISVWIYVL